MMLSTANCSSGYGAIWGGAVGITLRVLTDDGVPILNMFGPLMGGAVSGYATEMYCKGRFVSPLDREALVAMGYGVAGAIAGGTVVSIVLPSQ